MAQGNEAVSGPVKHITILPKGDGRLEGSCSICGMSVEVPPHMGPIPGDALVAEWAKQHLHKPKTRRARG